MVAGSAAVGSSVLSEISGRRVGRHDDDANIMAKVGDPVIFAFMDYNPSCHAAHSDGTGKLIPEHSLDTEEPPDISVFISFVDAVSAWGTTFHLATNVFSDEDWFSVPSRCPVDKSCPVNFTSTPGSSANTCNASTAGALVDKCHGLSHN